MITFNSYKEFGIYVEKFADKNNVNGQYLNLTELHRNSKFTFDTTNMDKLFEISMQVLIATKGKAYIKDIFAEMDNLRKNIQ